MSPGTETTIIFLLRQIIRAIELDSKKLSTQYNTTPAQILALRELVTVESQSLAHLAYAVGLSSSTMVGVVDRLEKKGLVVRNRALTDRRAVNIIITDAGKDYLNSSPSLLQDKLVHHLSGIQQKEKQIILESLETISTILNADAIDASPVLDSGGII
ncbi:MAG: MarR family transcriptional regulator [Candidatus Margulisbacteria bacterium]|jgi:DNA-binding MarR family transcriptional regulator|nr:MarR family transcriptional regulator [Candidatus Margulisiibacteriota bacterium]